MLAACAPVNGKHARELSHMEDKRLAGMTVNERLAELDLFDEWDDAVKRRDTQKMRKILLRCDLGVEFADQTVGNIMKNPGKYGF